MSGLLLAEVRWILVGIEDELVKAWESAFEDISQVEVRSGDILAQKADALVSPANSFGYMDGGLDLAISQNFGWGLEKRVRAELLASYDGELPVGQALIVETEREAIPWLISAPTMRIPMRVDHTANAHLAFRRILRAVRKHNSEGQKHPIRSVLCPGLGTGNGMMPPRRCARQMRYAFDVCVMGRVHEKGGLAAAARDHLDLIDHPQF